MSEFGVIPGILKEVFCGRSYPDSLALQITNLKNIGNEHTQRFRYILTDGEYSCHGICKASDGFNFDGVQKSSIIKIAPYGIELMGSGEKTKHVIIIGGFQVLESAHARIGMNKTTTMDEYFKLHPTESSLLGNASNAQSHASAAAAKSASPPPIPAATRHDTKPVKTRKAPERPNLFAIDQLSPYQNLWTIKARVSYKSPMRTWSNQKGEGKLFNVNFLDETNEIKATAFNDQADQLFDVLQEGKVFYVSKARINPARTQFSTLKHPYELSLDRDSVIEECLDDSDVPKLTYNFVPLSKVEDLEVNSVIDVVGVLREVNPAFQITSKSTGRPYDRRDVVLVDQSQFSITLGLWNKMALDFALPVNSVVAVKGARVQDFGGRSLSLTQSGTISGSPDVPEAFALKGWYDTKGQEENFKSLKQDVGSTKGNVTNDRKTIKDVQDEGLGTHEKPDYFNLKATINFIKSENFSYPACSSTGCNRKVIEQPDGTWRCEKCDVNHPQPNHRYILSCSILDHTGQIWVTLFDESAKVLLGCDANELHKIREQDAIGDSNKFQEVFEAINMKEFNFRISAREDNYNGVSRIRYQVQNIGHLDFNSECDALVDALGKLLN
ncbi:replication factor A subunit protein [Saccharomycopsis crataegensis]|uniref:Replication protein A subunit n=1 Tax=Saccharomycopsis crataegensis TaxID=43959 RepID=A0AAV5QWU1_9ASCO|nr:replication factor A subunit protein [Saccharomycopsis crataegensis]